MIPVLVSLAILFAPPAAASNQIHGVHGKPAAASKQAPLPPFKLDPRLIGTWWPEIDTLTVSTPGHPELRTQMMKAIEEIKEKLGYVNITFKADGTYEAIDPDNKLSHGEYRNVGNQVLIYDEHRKPAMDTDPHMSVSHGGEELKLSMSASGVSIALAMVKI